MNEFISILERVYYIFSTLNGTICGEKVFCGGFNCLGHAKNCSIGARYEYKSE